MWPENWPAWALFSEVSTQWIPRGMGGATGLNYVPLMRLLDMDYPDPARWREMLHDVQEIERAALKQMAKNQ